MRNRITPLLERFSLKFPIIIQAPMAGGITTPELVAAVSNAQALGSFATGYLKTEQVKAGIQQIKKLTHFPFAVNLFIPNESKQDMDQIKQYQHHLNKFRHELGMQAEQVVSPLALSDNFYEIIDVLLEEKIQIVSFTFGNLPVEVIQKFKKNSVYLMGTANSLEEAQRLASSEIDAIIAQGSEAGGHRGGFFTPFKQASVGTMALIPSLVRGIDRPIIAAGGIMDGRGIVAATALGACAVQMGTAFLSTKESGCHPSYKKELTEAKNKPYDVTTVTDVFSGKMARGINTSFIEYMEAHLSSVPDYPIPHNLSSPLRKEAAQQKATQLMSMWSGQGLPLITDNLSANALIEQLRDEIEASLKDFSVLCSSPSLHS